MPLLRQASNTPRGIFGLTEHGVEIPLERIEPGADFLVVGDLGSEEMNCNGYLFPTGRGPRIRDGFMKTVSGIARESELYFHFGQEIGIHPHVEAVTYRVFNRKEEKDQDSKERI